MSRPYFVFQTLPRTYTRVNLVGNPTSTWSDITSSVMDVTTNGYGLLSPKSGSPGVGTATVTLNNPTGNFDLGNGLHELYDLFWASAADISTLGYVASVATTFAGGGTTTALTTRVAITPPASGVYVFSVNTRTSPNAQSAFTVAAITSDNSTPQLVNGTATSDFGTTTLNILVSSSASWIQISLTATYPFGRFYIDWQNAKLLSPSSVSLISTLGLFQPGSIDVTGANANGQWAMSSNNPGFSTAVSNVCTTSLWFGYITDHEQTPYTTPPRTATWKCSTYEQLLQDATYATSAYLNTTANFHAAKIVTDFNAATTAPEMQLVNATYLGDPQVFATAFDKYTDNTNSMLQAMDDVVSSSFGTFYVTRTGRALFFDRNWRDRLAWAASSVTFQSGQPIQMKPRRTNSVMINRAKATAHPRTTLAVASVLSTSVGTSIPGKTGTGPGTATVTLYYRDAAGRPCAGTGIVTPVANTDYQITDNPNGLPIGFNYTTTPYVTVTYDTSKSAECTVTITNNATGVLYANILQIRGQPVITYDPVTVTIDDLVSQGYFRQKVYTKDLVNTSDQNFAISLSNYYVSRYAYPLSEFYQADIVNEWFVGGYFVPNFDIGTTITANMPSATTANGKHMVTQIGYEMKPKTQTLTTHLQLHSLAYSVAALWDTTNWDAPSYVWAL